ncbi:MAG: Glycerate dehydrogenase [Planctomycetes bacterium ADurb.Bin126]|nr:MAG: Glycerate dehydrogenase [Planctomycetes bacterium ADurb.Bin126]HOD84479.1 C-terminal binding protein [Phycisphaerae bacterium]HQL72969.1 C-terminal binding protein [Phycisphaerae bacterium]
MKPIVYITDFINDDLAIETSILGDLADVVALDVEGEQNLLGRIEDADCVMMYHFVTLRQATIERLHHCKLIVRCGVGIDNVDWAFARARGIPVCNVPDYGTEDVADSAMAMLLSLSRGVNLLNSRLRRGQGGWSYTQAVPCHRVRGRTLGIVGLGRIGTAMCRRAQAMGMDVVFHDPYLPDGWERAHGIRRAETLDELLPQAQALSLHCPLTPETTRLIGAGQIARMPKGSLLINTSRGAVLDTTVVPPAIRSGHLGGAGIDVLPLEPPPADDTLVTAWRDVNDPCHDRVILNPHAAFYSEEGLVDIRHKASHACRRALLGQELRNVVNA